LLFRFEIGFFLPLIYPRLDLRPSVALVPLIDFADLLGADLAGYKTITVCSTKVMHVSTEKWERGDVPSPAGVLPDPLAM
jgi:hypothetical protein